MGNNGGNRKKWIINVSCRVINSISLCSLRRYLISIVEEGRRGLIEVGNIIYLSPIKTYFRLPRIVIISEASPFQQILDLSVLANPFVQHLEFGICKDQNQSYEFNYATGVDIWNGNRVKDSGNHQGS